MKIYKTILSVMMIMFFAITVVLNSLLPDRSFSEAENRILSSRPVFSWNSLKEGKFTKEYEQYIIDQFAFRDFWVSVKSSGERVLQKKDNNGVYLGKDSYLLQKIDYIDKEITEKNIAAINTFVSNNPSVKLSFLLAPNSVSVLRDKLPPFAATIDQLEIFETIKKNLDSHAAFVDVYDELAKHKDEYIYYKTDHHWSSLGAYYAYNKAGSTLGYKPLSIDSFNIEKVTNEFYGTLYSKGNYRFIKPDSINIFKPKEEYSVKVQHLDTETTSDSLYSLSYLDKKDKYSVFLDGNHALSIIQTNNNKNKKLLVIKDSYAHSLVPFLTNNYNEIHMLDLRYFNISVSDYIKQNGISEILLLYNVSSFTEDNSIIKLKIK